MLQTADSPHYGSDQNCSLGWQGAPPISSGGLLLILSGSPFRRRGIQISRETLGLSLDLVGSRLQSLRGDPSNPRELMHSLRHALPQARPSRRRTIAVIVSLRGGSFSKFIFLFVPFAGHTILNTVPICYACGKLIQRQPLNLHMHLRREWVGQATPMNNKEDNMEAKLNSLTTLLLGFSLTEKGLSHRACITSCL